MKMIALTVWPRKKKNQIQKQNLIEPFTTQFYHCKLPNVLFYVIVLTSAIPVVGLV